jgi:uncharacterized protein (TIGR03437 family)
MKTIAFVTVFCTALFAQTPSLTYIANSSVKLYQVNGDCDWVTWDATINNKTPTCKPTTSQTLTKADVLGDDVPVVFENNGEMIVTFGDTIGAYNYAPWSDITNTFQWGAHDPIAHSTTGNASDGLLLNFFLNGTHGLEVQPPPQANGMAVDMGIDNVPNTGVSLNGTIYLGIKTGNVNISTGDNDMSHDYSVLATFNETTQTFTSGRTISVVPDGNFSSPVFYLAPPGVLGSPPPVSPDPVMLIFGVAGGRSSDIYLSAIPSTEFASGVDQNGNSATRYFAGMSNGQPTWSTSETSAAPIIYDVNPSSPTIGNLSVFYSQQLGLWLMLYDEHSPPASTKGVYFSSAPMPWGPWSTPQLVFNPCRDKGYGYFMFYYYATAAQNQCPSAMPAGVTSAPGSAGPAGPTIGDQTANNPSTTQGDAYAPELIQRFTIISGSTLKLFYMMATWNPYAVVMMESDFTITQPPVVSLAVNAEGGSPTIAPNTWVEINGTNLAPAGDVRIWTNSDFVNNQLPKSLDGVSVTVNGVPAYIYYISPTQINILTPPNAISGNVQVVVTVGTSASAPYSVAAQPSSPSFFVLNGGPYVIGQHTSNYSLIGPTNLYAGVTTPAKPGETIVLYANGFGPTTVPVVAGAETQSGNLSPVPTVTIGGINASVPYAALISPGLYQINVVVPANAVSGDNVLAATINGVPTSPVNLLTVQGAVPATTANFYVSPSGNDSWSGTLASANPAGTDGPFATFDHARAAVAALNKASLTQVTVQFRGGTYFLPATVQFSASDSGSATTAIVYLNYPNESPVFSGGMRLQNWTNTSGNTWKTTLPASAQYFETLYYNGMRRLRPRMGNGTLGAFFRIAATVYLPASATNCTVNIPNLGYECFDRFQYNPADPISGTWKNLAPAAGNPCNQPAGNQAIAGDIEVLDFEQFSTSKLRISCIDTVNHIVYLTGPTPISTNNSSEVGFIAGNRYLVDNIEDNLAQPGQWFLDHSTSPSTLTYLANAGENPKTDTVIAPQLAQLVAATGLQYVTFRGLTFEHDNYVVPAAGHKSSELEADIPGAVSFQNSQHVTFDSGTVTQISGTGLEFISCVSAGSPNYCVANSANAVTAYDVVENSAFYDIGALGVRIGDPYIAALNDANEPQFTTVQNNVVEGYGRTIPASFGIGQGMGHDNLYTHNDVYDGYHCAISTSQSIGDNTAPSGIGNANNVISFNHVWNLLQGIMNDGGSIRIDGGNQVFTAAGNKILNNRIHDVTDASIQDSNGYGGNGIYLDNNTGLVDVENNLVYRVSGNDVYTPQGPAAPNEANIIKNNILAYGRLGMITVNFPYPDGVPPSANRVFTVSNNLFYFDRSSTSSPKFWVQGGCVYSGGFPYTQFQLFSSNLYWRTDAAFASDAKAFEVQPNPVATGPQPPCSGNTNNWTFFTFAGWQQTEGEDLGSVVQNPGFNNPAYPADDYTLPKGSPGIGFAVFDYTQAGRSNPLIKPPAVAAGFPTMTFNPATDY